MRPILFDFGETDFSTNGKGRLVDATNVEVVEERNGIYEASFSYPVYGLHYDDIAAGATIGLIHDKNKDVQGFDVYGHSAPFNGIVTFYAHHVSYRLSNIIVQPFTATSCADAMAKISQNCANECPFTFWTDKDVTKDFSLMHPESVRSLLMGQAGSILDTYGKADYEFDNFTVKLWTNRGVDTGLKISYGRNLTGGIQEINSDNLFNAIAPYWVSEDEKGNKRVVYLPGIYVYRSGVTNPVPVAMDFSADFQEEPTQEQLRQRALKYLDDNQPWIPEENVSMEFSDLWGDSVCLCNKITASYPDLGLDMVKQKVIKLTYDVLLEKPKNVELGKPYKTYADQVSSELTDKLDAIQSQVNSRVSSGGAEETVLNSVSVQAMIDGIVTSALTEYALTRDLETLRSTLQSSITQLSSEVGIAFTATEERISTLQGYTESEIETINTFFRFTPTTQLVQGGLYIGESINEIKIKVAPDAIYYYRGADSNASEENALSYYKYDIFVAGNAIQIGAASASTHYQLHTLSNGNLVLDMF